MASAFRRDMGMFDNVVVLDQILRCPHHHRVSGFQTKSFDHPAMDVYLIDGGSVYLVPRGRSESDEHWQLGGGEAVLQYRYPVQRIVPPRDSVANVSQLLTIDRDLPLERAGRLRGQLMKDLENGLRLVLGL